MLIYLTYLKRSYSVDILSITSLSWEVVDAAKVFSSSYWISFWAAPSRLWQQNWNGVKLSWRQGRRWHQSQRCIHSLLNLKPDRASQILQLQLNMWHAIPSKIDGIIWLYIVLVLQSTISFIFLPSSNGRKKKHTSIAIASRTFSLLRKDCCQG